MKNSIGIDMTAFDDKNQLDIDSSNNIYLEKLNIMIIIHSIIVSLDYSYFILDYIYIYF